MDISEQINETSGPALSFDTLVLYFGGLFIIYMFLLWLSGEGKRFDGSGVWMLWISIFWAIVIGAFKGISSGALPNPFNIISN